MGCTTAWVARMLGFALLQGDPTHRYPSSQVEGGPASAVAMQVLPCSLDPATQQLITNIFSKEMFEGSMALMNLGEELVGVEEGQRGLGVVGSRRQN